MKSVRHLSRFMSTRAAPASSADIYDLDDPAVVESLRRQRFMPMMRFAFGDGQSKPWSQWGAAILVTVFAHALFVGSLAFGSRGKALRQTNNEGFSAASMRGDGKEVVSVLFFVNDKTIHVKEEGDESMYSSTESSLATKNDATVLATADVGRDGALPSLEVADIAAETSAEAFGDGTEASELYGRYMGQIKARIERVWEVPASVQRRTQCKVQIRQSPSGNVEDVTIQRCDLNPQEQLSLIRAIQSASPLSAPPREALFTELVTLVFVADRSHRPAEISADRTVRVAHVQIR